MGRVIRWALTSGVVEKAMSGRLLLCLDHATLDPVRTLEGTVMRHEGPAVVYRSRVLARQVPRDLFLDCDSAPVTAGTFVITTVNPNTVRIIHTYCPASLRTWKSRKTVIAANA